jgi:hypothetical protein
MVGAQQVGGTCKAIKDRLRFCSGQHFNVDQVLLANLLLDESLYQPRKINQM